MLVLDRQSAASGESHSRASNQAHATERIHLRLCSDGRVVEILPGKTIIGSSPRCNVRIQQPGVQPVHCLIVDGPEGLTVRSWARDTRLNGVSFVESPLGSGDCLSIGPVELEVINPQAPAAVAPAAAPAAKSPVHETADRSQINEDGKLARNRSRKLLATLRRERLMQGELRHQISELEQVIRYVAAERDSAGNKLENTMLELATVQQKLIEIDMRGEEHAQLLDRNQALSVEIASLTTRLNELTREQDRAAKDRQQVLKDIAALNEKHHQQLDENSRLQDLVHELTSQQSDVCGERGEFHRLNERFQAERLAVSAERASLADDRAALVVERDELQTRNDQLQTSLTRLQEEKSAIATDHAAAAGQRDKFERENDELQTRVAGLADENSRLIAAKQALADEQSRLQNENERLVELERELRTAVANRESTSEELYRALLQIAELQERADQNKALVDVYETLSGERDQLAQRVDELREQIEQASKERLAVESAWKALSDEAAALSDDKQRLAGENAQLLARLDEVARQLERDGSNIAAIEVATAELQRERDARAQAEASLESAITEAVIEAERKFANRSQQLEETVQVLEQRLANADEAGRSLDADRRESERQLSEAQKHAAELSERVAELESQLALAEERADQLTSASPAAQAPTWGEEPANVEPQPAAEANSFFGSDTDGAQSQGPAEIDWSVRHRSVEQSDELKTEGAASEWGAPTSAPKTWGASFGDEPAAEEKPSDWDQSAAAKGQIGDDGLFMSEAPAPAESAGRWGGQSTENSVEGSTEDDALEVKGAARESAAMPEAWQAPQEPAARKSAEIETPAITQLAAKSETPSYIERFAHMFNDDEAAQEQKVAPAGHAGQPGDGNSGKPRTMGIVRPEGQPSPLNEQDEESIEQYMAKLLSRVRGDSSASASFAMEPPSAPLNAPVTKSPLIEIPRTAPLPIPSAEPGDDDAEADTGASLLANIGSAKRKAANAAPVTDLSALRALANETARRAISRHELRKYRRNAVTKVIVSTLAGVTSLWMMLDSPNFKDIQFITACVSLIVAAIWAGETFRTFAESMRIAASDGPESGNENAEPVTPAALPIDVERG
jgi:hypothetical protein